MGRGGSSPLQRMPGSRLVGRLSAFHGLSADDADGRRGSSRGSRFCGSGRTKSAWRERTGWMDTPTPESVAAGKTTKKLLTASQLAERFAVSRNWVYQAVADDVLPHRRLGEDGPIRFVAAEIDE